MEQAWISVDDSSRAPTIESTGSMPESREVAGDIQETECTNDHMVICSLLTVVILRFPHLIAEWCLREMVSQDLLLD